MVFTPYFKRNKYFRDRSYSVSRMIKQILNTTDMYIHHVLISCNWRGLITRYTCHTLYLEFYNYKQNLYIFLRENLFFQSFLFFFSFFWPRSISHLSQIWLFGVDILEVILSDNYISHDTTYYKPLVWGFAYVIYWKSMQWNSGFV